MAEKAAEFKVYLRTVAKGERVAGRMYEKYAQKARRCGYEELAKVFDTTARSEYAHERLMLSQLEKLEAEAPGTGWPESEAAKGDED